MRVGLSASSGLVWPWAWSFPFWLLLSRFSALSATVNSLLNYKVLLNSLGI